VNHSRGEQAAIARVASDGSVVLRFADGQVAVIPAQEGERVPVRRTHRVRRRYYIQRRSVDLPEQPAPGYPYDRGD